MPAIECQPRDTSRSFFDITERCRVVVYAVFGDESHDETKARVFAVAGVFGSDDQWKQLKTKWLGRTGGRIFHASDCETNQGDFASTSNSDNKLLYKDLTVLLAESGLLGYGVAIDLAGHHQFFPDVPADIPYFICFRDVICQCTEWARMSVPHDSLKFTFDIRQESNYNAGALYDYMVKAPEWKGQEFDEIGFASRGIAEIQVADLYAREVMKHLDNMVGPIQRPTRLSMQALTSTHRFGANH
jgi:hypothetical protein